MFSEDQYSTWHVMGNKPQFNFPYTRLAWLDSQQREPAKMWKEGKCQVLSP